MPLTTLHVPLGRYRIDELLDQTQTGASYRAWDIESQTEVLLKEFVPPRGPGAAAKHRIEPAQRAAAVQALAHAHLVPVLDAFEEHGNHYWVTAPVVGETLAQRIRRKGALPEQHVVVWTHQLLEALAYCHDQGVVHGAVTPEHVVITREGDALLGDFQVWMPDSPGPHGDLSGLGAVLFQALTGQAPPAAGRSKQRRGRVATVRELNSSVSAQLDAAVSRALAPAPEVRWPDARAMAQALPAEDASAGRASTARVPVLPEAPDAGTVDETRAASGARRRRALAWVGVASGLAIIALAVVALLSRGDPEVPAIAPPPAAPVDVPVISTTIRAWDGMTMVYVPAGTFAMGVRYGPDDQRPLHDVTLDAFWLDQTEVTNAQYAQCVAAGVCAPSDVVKDSSLNGDANPVVGISWNDAAAYCAWAGARLPSEAEWEYAARGPEARIYPWGNDPLEGYANCSEKYCADGFDRTAPVGSFPQGASWVGALDMAGNAWEWVNDWYRAGQYGWSTDLNPTGPESGGAKVMRGGSWNYNWANVRSANRGAHGPGFRNQYIGFRCAGVPD